MAEYIKTLSANGVQTLSHRQGIKAYVDYAIAHGKDGLIVVGWLYDPEALVTGMALLVEARRTRFNKKQCRLRPLIHGVDNVYLERIHRQDVADAMRGPGENSENQYGLILMFSGFNGGELAFETADGGVVSLPINLLTDATAVACALDSCRPQCGAALSSGMRAVFGTDNMMSAIHSLSVVTSGWNLSARKYSTVDHAILLEGRYLLLNGWIAKEPAEIEQVTLSTGKDRIDITQRIRRYVRKDLFPAYPWSAGSCSLGFLCLLTDLRTVPATVMITIRTVSGEVQTHECTISRSDWGGLSRLVCEHGNDLALSAIQLLEECPSTSTDPQFRDNLAILRCRNLRAKYGLLGSFTEDANGVFASIDRGVPLGADGLLLFGWCISAGHKPVSCRVYDGNGLAVTAELTSLLRRDVVEAYRNRIPGVSSMCGFVCHVPLATRTGDMRVFAIDSGELGEIWLKIPVEQPVFTGIRLVRDLLGMIPEPMTYSYQLYELFDRALGPAIRSISSRTGRKAPDVIERQFGVPPESPVCSVIVPLYGRCDFMRFQLSHFADDPEFKECDLVYVVDDPELVSATLALAARFQPLFGIPFRVLWYGENRGFAGANNIGVQHARSDYIVLMNSDVLPQQHGWLSTLRQALETQDGAGAVGPLLEFADGSIQHAGMRPVSDAALPGFLLNSHAQMGTQWEGGDAPAEQVMLTAACLMLTKENYLAIGGLDEGYLVGDFEDSDLCLALRKRGFRLWLVPEARLWHLERQSVSLTGAAASRQLITLYNGWRYRQKILHGELLDPCAVGVLT